MSFSPGQLKATVAQFESTPLSVSAKLSDAISGPLYVVVTDAAGIIEPDIAIEPSDETHVKATLVLSENLPAGVQTGTLNIALCADPSCTDRLGSGALPYSITVQSGSNLTPLTPLVGAGDWTTPNGNVAQNRYVPVSLNPSDFSLRWIWSAPKHHGARQPLVPTAPVTSAGRVFALGNRVDGLPISPVLVAVRESDGQAEWRNIFPVYSFQGMPSVDESGLYMLGTTALNGEYQFSSIDPATGAFRFSSILAGANGAGVSPTIVGDRVIAHQGNALNAIEKSTGTVLWQRPGAGMRYVPTDGAQLFRADYLPDTGTPYLTTALDVQTGADIGSALTDNYGDKQIILTPDHTRAVVVESNGLDVLDASTYQDLITIPVTQSLLAVAVTNEIAYVVRAPSYGGAATLEAFDLATAASLWSVPAGFPDAGVADIIATDSHVFVSAGVTVTAFGTSSHVSEWAYVYGGRIALSANGILYISQIVPPSTKSNGRVVAINLH